MKTKKPITVVLAGDESHECERVPDPRPDHHCGASHVETPHVVSQSLGHGLYEVGDLPRTRSVSCLGLVGRSSLNTEDVEMMK